MLVTEETFWLPLTSAAAMTKCWRAPRRRAPSACRPTRSLWPAVRPRICCSQQRCCKIESCRVAARLWRRGQSLQGKCLNLVSAVGVPIEHIFINCLNNSGIFREGPMAYFSRRVRPRVPSTDHKFSSKCLTQHSMHLIVGHSRTSQLCQLLIQLVYHVELLYI